MYIPSSKMNGAKNGDRVVVRITDWEKKNKSPNGEVVSVLNAADENDLAMKGNISGCRVCFGVLMMHWRKRQGCRMRSAVRNKQQERCERYAHLQ